MSEKFQNKYRIPSTRLQNWDYGWNAAYFITICTQNMEHYFGDISNGKMKLSEIGELANRFWNEIPNHFPFVKLDAFVVMPNHIHGILIIDNPIKNNNNPPVETLHATSLRSLPMKNQKMADISPKPGSLPTIVRSYKSAVTKHARKTNPNFAWQPRFHDHIIKNNKSLIRIQNYIINNPTNWKDDEFYK
ncbi:transposase [Bacteroidota bacterium]